MMAMMVSNNKGDKMRKKTLVPLIKLGEENGVDISYLRKLALRLKMELIAAKRKSNGRSVNCVKKADATKLQEYLNANCANKNTPTVDF